MTKIFTTVVTFLHTHQSTQFDFSTPTHILAKIDR